MKVAVIGAGWAGCAAAVESQRLGHRVTLFEAARTPGGRARAVSVAHGEGDAATPLLLDNGQHILLGAYAATLKLMADLGVDAGRTLLRMPLTMQFSDGSGLKLPDWPAPLDALAGILGARGWTWADRLSLLRVAAGWQLGGFQCAPSVTVSALCQGLSAGAMRQLIEPLCVSALNTPPQRASGQVFLRVMRDALFSASGGSNLLLPRTDLGALLPDAALGWLAGRGATVITGSRVKTISPADAVRGAGWVVSGDAPDVRETGIFDAVILACPPAEAARLALAAGDAAAGWIGHARQLTHEAITTVYAQAPGERLTQPMLALHASEAAPAQFVFDRGQLGGPEGLLAFVVSASTGDAATLTGQVLAQGLAQLGLRSLQPVRTIVEKRATFACTPGLVRPALQIADSLLACGDYVDGPYPATLEGAVRSGLAAARQLD